MIRPPYPVQCAIQLLHEISPLSPPLAAYLSAFFESKEYQPGEYLLRNGETCCNLLFIARGLVQVSCEPSPAPEIQGKGIGNCFLMDGDTAIPESFFSQAPADEYMRALEHTTVAAISAEALEEVYASFPEFNYYARRLTENYYVKTIRQSKALRYRRAADSYSYLEKQYPSLVSRVPAKYLAGYLGVDETYVHALYAKRKSPPVTETVS